MCLCFVYDVLYMSFVHMCCNVVGKLTSLACNVCSYKCTALWTIWLFVFASASPLLFYVLYSKACGNLGVLPCLVANLLGASLGRDRRGDNWLHSETRGINEMARLAV